MQFDKIDKKIKEAADHHHPAYDEKAWSGMEKLLNKHLPQMEDGRKRFIFFILFLLGLGVSGLLIAKPWKGKKSTTVADQMIQQKPLVIAEPANEPDKQISKTEISGGGDINKVTANVNGNGTLKNNNKTATDVFVSQPPGELTKKSVSQKNKNNYIRPPASKTSGTEKVREGNIQENNIQPQDYSSNNTRTDSNTTSTAETSKQADKIVITEKIQNELVVANSPEIPTTKPVINEQAETGDVKKEAPAITQNKVEKDKKKNKKTNSFFVTLSAAPDVSYVDNGKLGAMKLLAGGGFGYTIKERFTIRTGFYSGRKIYTASPDAYNPPAIFYTYYPNLEKVDANCKVYEIPFSISYHFGSTPAKNWFAAASISSYLMKSETYNYFYKYSPAGPTVSRKWTINNENKHYFSALTFSAGYLHTINKSIFVIVEPYMKVPLSGVGYGKVKLSCAGLLFSLGIKPFAPKKTTTKK